MVNEIILQLVDEMVKPEEITLENTVEDTIELEDDTIIGAAEDGDDIIELIDRGEGIGYRDPEDFTDQVYV